MSSARFWNWAHRHALWREVSSTFSINPYHGRSGYTRALYHTRIPLSPRAVKWLAQNRADRDNRAVFVDGVAQRPRYRRLRAWEVTYR